MKKEGRVEPIVPAGGKEKAKEEQLAGKGGRGKTVEGVLIEGKGGEKTN